MNLTPEQLEALLNEKYRLIDESKKDAEAISRVLDMVKKQFSEHKPTEVKAEVPDGKGIVRYKRIAAPGSISLVDAVEKAINAQTSQFTVRDIAEWLEHRYSELRVMERVASVSATLLTLESRKVIQIVEKGQGSRPTKYQRVSPEGEGG